MNGLLLRWVILTISILLTAYLLDGIQVTGFFPALLAAAVLGILNVFFRPIALIITLPINFLTLGLFTFLINAAILKMSSSIIPGFRVDGFWTAVFGSFLISLVSFILNTFMGPGGRMEMGGKD